MSKKHKKFRDNWANQTEIGRRFGISAVEVGNMLVKHALKDKTSRQATQKALSEEYAKSTPLKDGTPFCLWNIDKINAIISQTSRPLSQVELHVNEVLKTLSNAEKLIDEGNDKLGFMMVHDPTPKGGGLRKPDTTNGCVS